MMSGNHKTLRGGRGREEEVRDFYLPEQLIQLANPSGGS